MRSADTHSATLTVALISAAFAYPIFTPAAYQVPDVPLTIHWSAWAINGILGYALCGFIPTIHFIHSVSPWA